MGAQNKYKISYKKTENICLITRRFPQFATVVDELVYSKYNYSQSIEN